MDCIRPVIEIFSCIGGIIGIVSVLWPCCEMHANYLSELQENGESLEKALNELMNAKDDVQKKVDDAEANPNEPMKRNDQVNGWLQTVTSIEGEVRGILQQVDQQISRRCLGGCCPNNCWKDYIVGKLVVQKIASLNELREKGHFEEVAYKLPPPSVQGEPTTPTVGMESMFEKAWRLIGDDEVRIMGLFGQGGVGKTTLLKQINNELIKSGGGGFDVVILVVVSKVINMEAIRNQIGKRLRLSSPNKTSIFNALSKKNFLLLLDDIWERVDLQRIGVPHPENCKSKVIFTTRSETVCGLMDANKKFRVECLSPDVAWTLFQNKVGSETLNSFPNARELAKVVAKECDGLPLALITIGRDMSTRKTIQEWNHAITTLRKSASEFPGMGDNVLPLLKLSYDNLRNDTIKSCFLYCALYPEDHSINIEKLIHCWIGEGFLNEFNHINEARNHGYDVIGILKGACLLESGKFGHLQVKMHDTIRDLALWITHECGGIKRDKIVIIGASDYAYERLWYDAERICLRSLGRSRGVIKVAPPKSPNLRTLIYADDTLAHHNLPLPRNFFQFMPLLRVLDLSCSQMKTFPTSITELLELQYLSLSMTCIQVLPEELGKLVKLKYLDLSYMYNLRTIPSGVIGSLLELRVLNLHRSCEDWDFEEMYNLKHLNDLGITINTQQNLNQLLSLSNQNLQTMCEPMISMATSPSSSTTTFGVDSTIRSLEKLKLLSNLEMLSRYSFHDLCSCFQNLSEIIISKCHALKDLTWVVYMRNLKRLDVESCEEIEEIIGGVVDDFGGIGRDGFILTKMRKADIFKSLKILQLACLPKLKSICRNALAFPCLESMYIDHCPKLKKLPFDSGSNVNNTLQSFSGGRKWWSELQWEEDHDNVDTVKSKFFPLW